VIASAGAGDWIVPAILAVLVLAAVWVGVRWYNAEAVASLGGVPLFASMSSSQLRAIASSAARQDVAPGSRIVTEGEPGDGFYLIEKGSATVSVRGEETATLGPGGHFGEMAVIDHGPRSATITADTSTTVLHLPSSALETAIRRDPSIGDAIEDELRARLRAAGAAPQEAAQGGTEIERLAALSRELRSVRHVDWATASTRRRGWFGRS
jgi:CRP/FNR family cyclic AMP-dependent transcriptional regulator